MTITCERQFNFAGWSIIGAVTYVYLSDAAQGCGMYIEWMLGRSDALAGMDQAA